MPRFTTQFGGINSDVSPNHLPSGSADIALNVLVEKGDLQKRAGFASWGTVTGNVMGLWQVRFGDEDVYVVAKSSNGNLYQRKVYPADAGSFSQISTEQTHDGDDIGWGFMWYNRWHYFDRGGGSRWNPDINSGKAYKAGLPRSTVGATPAAAAAGTAKGAGMHGKYRVVPVWRFSETAEEGQFAGPQAAAVQCALNTPDDSSGMAISNWATIVAHADASAYEIDEVHFYVSKGHTEYVPRGDGYEAFPHKYYDGSIRAIVEATASVNKGDHISDVTTRLTNAGGEPPASAIGCYTGVRALYSAIYVSDTLVPGKIMFSIPDFPTMVPQRYTYTQGGDSKTVEPEPWLGESYTPIDPTEILFAGGRAVAFTPTEVWALSSYGDGRLYTKRVYSGAGCVAHGAATVAGSEIHAFGLGTWSVVGEGVYELSHRRFRDKLAEIGVANFDTVRMAFYSFEDQVWAAGGDTIYVWDRHAGVLGPGGRAIGALVEFQPANITGGTITAMMELAYTGLSPLMLVAVGTNIYKYPSGTKDGNSDFVARWRGYFGQERFGRDQKIESLRVFTGENCKDNVTLKYRAMHTADDDRTQYTKVLAKSDDWEGTVVQLNEYHGNVFQVEFYSSGTAQWTIRGLAWHITADDVRG